MKSLIILSSLLLFGCVEKTKEQVGYFKSMFDKSAIGKNCDEKNKVVCYSRNEKSFNCVQVEKPICKKEEMIK